MRTLTALLMLSLLAMPALAQDWAKPRLDNSPRHLEWLQVRNGSRAVNSFVAYPEKSGAVTGVIVIHEIFGLTDWVRGVTDQLAEAGYVALAPDFLSGMDVKPGGDEARAAIGKLPPDQVMGDVRAAVQKMRSLPGCNGRVALAGFCWGGTQTFRYVTEGSDVDAAFVFYGSAPDDAAALERIRVPVHGFYAQDDARINDTLGPTVERMQGRLYLPLIYAASGHGFMRAGEAPDATVGNALARKMAWERWLEVLATLQ